MRSVAWLRLSVLVIAGLVLAAGDAARAAGGAASYTALAGMPQLATRGYSIAVAPPGYPPVRLYAEETGRGPPLLFLHGLGASGYTLRRITANLAASHRVITLDLRGFGRSDKPFDQYYSALDQAAHVKQFILQRGLAGITLAGHSFGGGVALALTLDLNQSRPGAISRLVLMNAPAFPQPMTHAVGFLRTPIVPYLALTLLPRQITAQMSLTKAMGNFDHITESDVERYAMPFAEAGAAHALITTAQRIVPADLPDIVRRYPSIHQPTLLVWCAKDPVVPLVIGVSLQRMLPNARLRIIDGCTHVPPEEAPDELLLHMQMFLYGQR